MRARALAVLLCAGLSSCSLVDTFGDFRFPAPDVPPDDAPEDVGPDIEPDAAPAPDAALDVKDDGGDFDVALDVAFDVALDRPDRPDGPLADVRDATDVSPRVDVRDVTTVPGDAGTCPPGQTPCGSQCTDLQSDPFNCGRCRNTCLSGPNVSMIACREGACAPVCRGGSGNCDGDPANGCEAELNTVANCGRCGGACTGAPNATPTCGAMGVCAFTCATNFANCDASTTNGCETDVRASFSHCGRCGNSCSLGQTCVGGACTTLLCPMGQAECDFNPLTLCETNTQTSESHCGRCGARCAASATCVAGACRDFFGTFTQNEAGAGCASLCEFGNPQAMNRCACPTGTSQMSLLYALSDCGMSTRLSNSAVTLCAGPSAGGFGGVWQRSLSTGGCLNPNVYSTMCSCPSGTSPQVFSTVRLVRTDGGQPTREVLQTAVCVAPSVTSATSFGGFYIRSTAADAGTLCRVPNFYTSMCSCPSGFTPQPLATRIFLDGMSASDERANELYFCSR